MSETKKLDSEFIIELLKATLVSPKILEICNKHLKYQYLETETQKKVYKYILNFHLVNKKAPSLGLIGQEFNSNKDVIGLLAQIKKANVEDVKDDLIQALEDFIKDVRFLVLYDTIGDMYNEGKKQEGMKLLAKESAAINEFKLKDAFYATVFSGFNERQAQRQIQSQIEGTKKTDKLVWGIKEMDDWTGGVRRGTLAAWMAQSGGGKSTAMRWWGLSNARLGSRIVHFSQEGSEEEVLAGYDSAWTSIDLSAIELGLIPDAKQAGITKAWKTITANKGEIYVFAVESFDSLSLIDCRQICRDIVEESGPIDGIIFDYLELFSVSGDKKAGNDSSMERIRREAVANGMVNLAIEFNAVSMSATQSQDIPEEKYNNPEFVMKRSHLAEFKGLVRPMAYFVTINATDEEKDEGIARIWFEKLRKHKLRSTPINIAQALNIGRFYDAAKTHKLFFEDAA